MADNNHSSAFWKPWRDGWLENTTKFCGGVLMFLFVSGLFGAGYDPVASNPFVWGVYIRAGFLNITGR